MRYFRPLAFIVLAFASAACAADLKAGEGERVFRVGFVSLGAPEAELANHSHPFAKILVEGLRDRGWIDGKNVLILWKSSLGREDLLRASIDALVSLPVDVLVLIGNGAVEEALKKTRTLPIVAVLGNTSGQNLVASLSRPGGNVTGMSTESMELLTAKRMALLMEVAKVKRIAYLMPMNNPANPRFHPSVEAAARHLGIAIAPLVIAGPTQLEPALATLERDGRTGLIGPDTVTWGIWGVEGRLQDLIVRHRLPAISTSPDAVRKGWLLAYGPEFADNIRRLPYFIDRILKGAKPSELPIEQPQNYRLGVNLATAKAMGITIPPSVLLQADLIVDKPRE